MPSHLRHTRPRAAAGASGRSRHPETRQCELLRCRATMLPCPATIELRPANTRRQSLRIQGGQPAEVVAGPAQVGRGSRVGRSGRGARSPVAAGPLTECLGVVIGPRGGGSARVRPLDRLGARLCALQRWADGCQPAGYGAVPSGLRGRGAHGLGGPEARWGVPLPVRDGREQRRAHGASRRGPMELGEPALRRCL